MSVNFFLPNCKCFSRLVYTPCHHGLLQLLYSFWQVLWENQQCMPVFSDSFGGNFNMHSLFNEKKSNCYQTLAKSGKVYPDGRISSRKWTQRKARYYEKNDWESNQRDSIFKISIWVQKECAESKIYSWDVYSRHLQPHFILHGAFSDRVAMSLAILSH